jgi:tetratricopeptide (TPR) repeat protein
MQNEIDEAINYLDTAFSKNNKDIVTILYLGAAYRDKGDIENAFKFLQMVEEVWMNRYVIESYIQLASLYQQEKVFAKSIEYYIKAIQKDPERISLKFRLAAVYDEYYSDKQKALNLFLEYANDSTAADPVMLDYARKRIEAIKEKIFFSK